MVAEKEIVRQKTLEEVQELAKCLARECNTVTNWRNAFVHSHSDIDDRDFKEAFRWLNESREEQDQAYWLALVLLLLACFIEWQVEKKVEDRFLTKFDSFFRSKLLKALLDEKNNTEKYGHEVLHHWLQSKNK